MNTRHNMIHIPVPGYRQHGYTYTFSLPYFSDDRRCREVIVYRDGLYVSHVAVDVPDGADELRAVSSAATDSALDHNLRLSSPSDDKDTIDL